MLLPALSRESGLLKGPVIPVRVWGVLGATCFGIWGRIRDSGWKGSTCSDLIVDIVNGEVIIDSKPARLVIGVCALDPGGEGNFAIFFRPSLPGHIASSCHYT